MTDHAPALQRNPALPPDDDRFGELLVGVVDRARRPMAIGAVLGAAVGLIGALNETDFLVLAVGISATFLAFFAVEAALSMAGYAVRSCLGRSDPDPELLVAAARDWSGPL